MSSHPIPTDSYESTHIENVCEILDTEQLYESPIDINISRVAPVHTSPRLEWINFDSVPKKMKITNTGHTVILSGKWGQERPYLTSGVLTEGKYVFSQMHFHWGVNDMEGSEHTIDGRQFPGELHVVLFKSSYLTQEAALKERDGIVILVYILDLQEPHNMDWQSVVDALPAIAKAHTSAKITPEHLNSFFRHFEADYFMYKGSVSTSTCVHPIMWVINRTPIGISSDQIDSFRYLLDNDDEIIRRNFRPLQPVHTRHVFHILPSSSNYATLLPTLITTVLGDKITQIYTIQTFFEAKLKNKEFDQNEDEEIVSRTLSILSQISKYIDFVY